MKLVLQSYFRFKKQHSIVASEVGAFNADILTISKKNELIEVEIKTSKADFNADFKKKKHQFYKLAKNAWTPHKFYFAVPKEILEYCANKLVGSPYGLLEITPEIAVKKKKFYANSEDFLHQRIETAKKHFKDFKLLETGIEKDHNGREDFYFKFEALELTIPQDRVKIIKKASFLHKRETISEKVKYYIIHRMSSELIGLRKRLSSANNKIKELKEKKE